MYIKYDFVGTPKGMQCTQGGDRWRRKLSCLKEYLTKHIKHLGVENPIKCYHFEPSISNIKHFGVENPIKCYHFDHSWSLLKVHLISMQTPTAVWIIVAFKSHAYPFFSYTYQITWYDFK